MIKFLSLLFALPSIAFALNIKDSNSPSDLEEAWHEEEIYFLPKNKSDLQNWSGTLYHERSKKCFSLKHDQGAKTVTAARVKCEPSFLKKATEPYLKISDFKVYEAKLLACLDQIDKDKKCLRGFISRVLQLSFGVDGFQDRRDLIAETWKKEDYQELRSLLKKGTVGEENSRSFPPEVGDEGMGQRGEFVKKNGGWLLKSYLGGD